MAQSLERSIGTLRTELRRGSERLHGRLLRRGVAPSVALPGAVGSSDVASASVPVLVARSTTEAVFQPTATKTVPTAVAALTAGVCRAMFLTKLIIAVVAILAVGAASLRAVQTIALTWAKPGPIGSATRTASARIKALPEILIANSLPAFEVWPPIREILAKLQEPIDMVSPRETPRGDVFRYIK